MTPAATADAPAVAQVAAQLADQEHELSELVQFRMEDGYLLAEFNVPKEMLKSEPTPLRIKGSSAAWSIRSGNEMPRGHFGATSEPIIQLTYTDAGGDTQEGYTHATVHSSGALLSITGKIRLNGDLVNFAYHGRRDYGSAQLEASVQRQEHWNEPLVTVYGDTLRELYAEHSLEVDRYLGPVLKKVSQRNLLGPGAADVYGAFASIAPSEQAVAALREVLPKLNSPDAEERQEASQAMAKLGGAGVLAAMRFEAEWLSPEQRSRLAGFIDSNRQRRILGPDAARGDLRFLVECLEHDDPAVRTEARKAMEQVLQRELSFDPAAGFDERFSAVQALRKELRL